MEPAANRIPLDGRGPEDVFLHQALDLAGHQIRVLDVFPGTVYKPLRCSLRHVLLSDRPSYEPISYVWGDSSVREQIEVDGKRLSVPRSSAAALRKIRLEAELRTVWIDAICIDQTNSKEKNHQVFLMRKIFTQGQSTLIYFGEADDALSTRVEHAFDQVLKDCDEEAGDLQGMRKLIMATNGNPIYSLQPFRQNIDFEALTIFGSLPWNYRVWVMQEGSLGQGNLCYYGNIRITLADVVRAGAWLHHKQSHIPHALRMTGPVRSSFLLQNALKQEDGAYGHLRGEATSRDVASTLAFGNSLRALEPKDHVFGLLGLMKCTACDIPPLLLPDYSKTDVAVFQDATTYAVLETGFTEVFKFVRHRSLRELIDPLWPSWVPKWSRNLDAREDCTALGSSFSACNATHWIGASPTAINGDTIHVSGLQVGRVWESCAVFAESCFARPEVMRDLLLQTHQLSRAALGNRTNGRSFEKMTRLVGTLLAGTNCDGQVVQEADVKGYQAFMHFIATKHRMPPYTDTWTKALSHEDEVASRFAAAFYNSGRNRRFLVTDEGGLALGPQITVEGDLIVILQGGPTPYVLRPWYGKYKLVGECYVDGIMHGEIIARSQSLNQSMDTFEIY